MKHRTLILFLIVFIFLIGSIKAQIPISGLIAYYPFNGNANDASGNNNNGVNYGAQLTTDRFGNPNSAYFFDGHNKFIAVPSSPSLTSPTNKLTMAAWAMVAGHTERHYILDKRLNFNTSAPYTSYVLFSAPETEIQTWQTFVSPSPSTTTGTSTLKENIWSFIVGVYDGANIKVYVNGILEATTPCTGNIIYTDLPLYIGAVDVKPKHSMYGKIDDVRIYNQALTQEEILILFNETNNAIPTISGIQSLCAGDKGVFYVISNMDSIVNYSWYYSGNGASIKGSGNNVSIDFADIASSGTLTVLGTKADGSQDSAKIDIAINPIPIALISNNSPVCLGNQILLQAQAVPGGLYTWTGPNAFSSTAKSPVINNVTFANEGTYTLQVSANGCNSVPTDVDIEVIICQNPDLSVLKTINNSSPLVGESVIFTITASNIGSGDFPEVIVEDILQSGYTYVSSIVGTGEYNPANGIWTIGTLNSGSSESLIIIALVNSDGSYANTASIQGFYSESNMSNNSSTTIASPSYFNIPNSFSPNGDGINDAFVIRGLNENSRLIIFNRLGAKIYESENYQNDWIGFDSKGNELDSDTYWYCLIVPGIPTEFKGFVYLKK